jgi:UDP-2,4-diacetamido-2,4,6-trideoxy-beta-L-altropyranose hydrolase
MIGVAGEGLQLLVRVDASTRIGAGHLMRCLSLAQQWTRAGGTVVFAMHAPPPFASERLAAEGFDLEELQGAPGSPEDADETRALARRVQAHAVVVDGYVFEATYQARVHDPAWTLLCLDDYGHAGHYHADLVLNQNLGGARGLYARREPYTRLLLGARYAMLRQEFRPFRGLRRTPPERARRVLVTLGAGDPGKATSKAIEALASLEWDDLNATVVIGGGNPHADEITRAAARVRGRVAVEIDVRNMAPLMAAADLAIAACGSTCWELSFIGVPSVVFVTADNQAEVGRQLRLRGLARVLGRHEEISPADIAAATDALAHDPEERHAMMARGQALIDGAGGERVVRAIIQRIHAGQHAG